MASVTEPPRLSGLIKNADDPTYTREGVTLLAGSGSARVLSLGTILGLVTKGTVTITPGTNTGNGVLGTVTLGALALVGDYILTCVTAAANGGRFQVVDPTGNRLADLLVAVAYVSSHFGATLADGSTDFAVGDKITVSVAAGSGKALPLSLTAVDGSAVPYGVLLANITVPDGVDTESVALVRGCAVVADVALTYPAGATTNQKSVINAALGARGIVVRQGV